MSDQLGRLMSEKERQMSWVGAKLIRSRKPRHVIERDLALRLEQAKELAGLLPVSAPSNIILAQIAEAARVLETCRER